MGTYSLDRVFLAFEAGRSSQGVSCGVRRMSDHVDKKLRHCEGRTLDWANCTSLVEEMREIGDLHRA